MKYLFLFSFTLFNTILMAQIGDYHQIELDRGSRFIGKIVDETKKHYLLETNLADTFYIKRNAVKRLYIIKDKPYSNGDVPILTKGFYKTLLMGCGTGSRVTNPQWLSSLASGISLFSIFTPISPQLLIPQSTLLSVYKLSYSMGYQFNRHFGVGMGINIDALRQDRILDGNVFFEQFNVNPYFQAKVNYPLPNFGNKDLWVTVNAFRHTEIMTGMSFYSGKDVYMLGIGWYRSYFTFKTENYISLQLGLQF
ncbi:MAG: hypothetical protein AB8G11_09080 [Saprospiraceae bacterium]